MTESAPAPRRIVLTSLNLGSQAARMWFPLQCPDTKTILASMAIGKTVQEGKTVQHFDLVSEKSEGSVAVELKASLHAQIVFTLYSVSLVFPRQCVPI